MPDFKDKAEFEDVYCEKLADSLAAALLVIDGRRVWMPVSQIDDDSEVWKPGQRGKLVVSEWIAIQKGLI